MCPISYPGDKGDVTIPATEHISTITVDNSGKLVNRQLDSAEIKIVLSIHSQLGRYNACILLPNGLVMIAGHDASSDFVARVQGDDYTRGMAIEFYKQGEDGVFREFVREEVDTGVNLEPGQITREIQVSPLFDLQIVAVSMDGQSAVSLHLRSVQRRQKCPVCEGMGYIDGVKCTNCKLGMINL